MRIHFLPAFSYSSPRSCMISPMDFSISSILFPNLTKKRTHLINSTDDISRHFVESVLHLFKHVLNELIQLFGWRIIWDLLSLAGTHFANRNLNFFIITNLNWSLFHLLNTFIDLIKRLFLKCFRKVHNEVYWRVRIIIALNLLALHKLSRRWIQDSSVKLPTLLTVPG